VKKLASKALVGATVGLVMVAVAPVAPASSAAPAAPATAPASAVTNTATVPVTGRLADGSGNVTGTYTISQFVERDGGLAAVGTFTGSVTDATGAVRQGSQEMTVPVTATTSPAAPAAGVTEAAADCPILHLNLAPLHLDLLGLVVDLDRVVLDIVAQSGAGNLLGNLLCAVTGLLDGAGLLSQIVLFLNQILALLGPSV
jgi:hypothetical protein